MIIIEIAVPSLDRVYEFKINDDIPVQTVIDEIVSVICQKEKCRIIGNAENFMLFKTESNDLLSMDLSLYENRIKTGDKLILV